MRTTSSHQSAATRPSAAYLRPINKKTECRPDLITIHRRYLRSSPACGLFSWRRNIKKEIDCPLPSIHRSSLSESFFFFCGARSGRWGGWAFCQDFPKGFAAVDDESVAVATAKRRAHPVPDTESAALIAPVTWPPLNWIFEKKKKFKSIGVESICCEVSFCFYWRQGRNRFGWNNDSIFFCHSTREQSTGKKNHGDIWRPCNLGIRRRNGSRRQKKKWRPNRFIHQRAEEKKKMLRISSIVHLCAAKRSARDPARSSGASPVNSWRFTHARCLSRPDRICMETAPLLFGTKKKRK